MNAKVRMGGSSYVFTQAALLRRCSLPNHYHRSKWVPEFDNRNPFLPHKSQFSTCHQSRSTGHSPRQNLCECQTPLLQTKLLGILKNMTFLFMQRITITAKRTQQTPHLKAARKSLLTRYSRSLKICCLRTLPVQL